MSSHHARRIGIVGVLTVALLSMAGCNGGDPTGTQPNTQLTGPQAQDWTLEVLHMLNGMSTNVDDWASAQFTGLETGGAVKVGEEPVFDESEMAWILHYEGPVAEVTAPDYMYTSLDYYLQFRDGGGNPVMQPESAVAYLARVAMGLDAHQEQEGTVSDMAYTFSTELEVAGLDTDTYSVNGSGSSAVELAVSGPDGSGHMDFAMSWGMDLSVPADGSCPSGSAEVHAGGFDLHAIYDGEGNADWTLSGPDYQASGTEKMDCGLSVAAH